MNGPFTNSGKFGWIWEKYRPVILQLMIASSERPQQYQLSGHEFKDANNKKPTGYSFILKAYQSRSENDIKKSLVAQDLLQMLKNSIKAEELLSAQRYEFELDKNFVIHVRQPTEE